MKQLTDAEFESTFTPPMIDITSNAEELLDIWPYIDKVIAAEYATAETDDWDVQYVYMNQPGSHQHILIDTGMPNIYLVVVITVRERVIFGHYLLNLNHKYQLDH